MLKGQLWLDYDNGEDEEHWEASVTCAILRDDEVVVEFSGRDPDFGKFSGSFKACKVGPRYVGGGSFTVQGASTTASVSVILTNDGDSISIEGTWQDSGDSEAYDLTAELEHIANNSSKRTREKPRAA